MSDPTLGERTGPDHPGLPLEWTGNVWAPICPPCDIPMTARDYAGCLCCASCGRLASDR